MAPVDGIAGDLILSARDYARSRLPWLRTRRSGLGASDTAAVLQLSDWATPLAIWNEKTATGDVRDSWLNEAAEWGSVLEAPVARRVAARHPDIGKLAPTPGILAHAEHRWMLATLDRLILPRGRRAGTTPTSCLEIKTCGEWVYRKKWIDGDPPVYIQIQCQQQLAVTGFDHLWLGVLVGGQYMPEPIRIERNDEVIDQIINYGGIWWRDYVEAGVRPPLTFGDRDQFARYYPGDADLPAIPADEPILDVLARYDDARRREKEGKDEKDRLALEIKLAMGDRQAVTDADGRVYATCKAGTSRRLDQTLLKTEQPELHARYSPAKPTRTLLVKDLD